MFNRQRRSRREFLGSLSVALGAGALPLESAPPQSGRAGPTAQTMTIQDVVDIIIKAIPGVPIKESIDTFKAGDPSQRVTGIVTTFLATLEVLHKAKEIGANLVITHEPTYYNHFDKVDALRGDPVYETKSRFIKESGIVIWRFHDYWHMHEPDGIIYGLVRRMGWEKGVVEPNNKRLYDISSTTFEDLCRQCKEKLGIANLRVVGDPRMICRRIGLFAGWGGLIGDEQITLLTQKNADVIVCGETVEGAVSAYARDAVVARLNKGLIILGHANSEEPGMADVVDWLKPRLPGVKISFIPAGNPFRFL